MPSIARNGDAINNVVASSHITIGYWNSGTETSGGFESTSTTSATITGSLTRTNGSVYANNSLVCVKSGNTTETDNYSIPNGWYYKSGAHTNAIGSILGGSTNVYVNGLAVARRGDSVRTHTGGSTTVGGGSSNVFVNG